jgi:hydroxyethylthiazole kinase-like sugar kinase family protein
MLMLSRVLETTMLRLCVMLSSYCFSQCRQVLKSAEQSSHPLTLIIYAIEASRMRIEEAKLMYKQVRAVLWRGSMSDIVFVV